MTTKTYTTRDSATSALRKVGLQARDYNLFITKMGDKFECKLGDAIRHLDSLKNPKTAESAVKVAKPRKLAEAKVVEVAAKRSGISSMARELILDGKTNQEVWEALRQQFHLNDSKKHYPTWYRCEMKRTGLLPKNS